MQIYNITPQNIFWPLYNPCEAAYEASSYLQTSAALSVAQKVQALSSPHKYPRQSQEYMSLS